MVNSNPFPNLRGGGSLSTSHSTENSYELAGKILSNIEENDDEWIKAQGLDLPTSSLMLNSFLRSHYDENSNVLESLTKVTFHHNIHLGYVINESDVPDPDEIFITPILASLSIKHRKELHIYPSDEKYTLTFDQVKKCQEGMLHDNIDHLAENTSIKDFLTKSSGLFSEILPIHEGNFRDRFHKIDLEKDRVEYVIGYYPLI